jgi:hypothetical protein
MHKYEHRDARSMQKQVNMIDTIANSIATDSKKKEIDEVSEK